MSELRRRRSVDVVFIDAIVTVLAGVFLYWHDWHLYPTSGDRIGSNFGAALTVGALLAIAGLGSQVTASGGTPPQELTDQIGGLQRRLVVAERVSFPLVLLAVVAMASARYL